MLLVATLLRLALNVASTRIVLLEGHNGGDAAGKVIEAFGAFVIGGNYAVGLVVFAIPSDDFNQELGSAEEVREFCEMNYGIDMPIFRANVDQFIAQRRGRADRPQ